MLILTDWQDGSNHYGLSAYRSVARKSYIFAVVIEEINFFNFRISIDERIIKEFLIPNNLMDEYEDIEMTTYSLMVQAKEVIDSYLLKIGCKLLKTDDALCNLL